MTNTPRSTLDKEAVAQHFTAAVRRRTPAALWTALADVPVLLAETERLTTLLASVRTEYANLLAAARATIHAEDDREPDPLWFLRDEMAAHDPFGGDGR